MPRDFATYTTNAPAHSGAMADLAGGMRDPEEIAREKQARRQPPASAPISRTEALRLAEAGGITGAAIARLRMEAGIEQDEQRLTPDDAA